MRSIITVHKLKNLGYDFKDTTTTMLIMVSLLDSYASLRQHPYMKNCHDLAK